MQQTPGWTVLRLSSPLPLADLVSTVLNGIGCLGVEVKEEGQTAILSAYFEPRADPRPLEKSALKRLSFFGESAPVRILGSGFVPKRDWVADARDDFPPVEAGDHFIVHPSWAVPAEAGRIRIEIDPEQAFGTGSHESTRLCISLMEKHLQKQSRRILDVGCGSGILLIAAAKWVGAVAGDCDLVLDGIDPHMASVRIARKNLHHNRTPGAWKISRASVETFQSEPYDFVFANILSGTLTENFQRLDALLAPCGILILSGVLLSEHPDFYPGAAAMPWALLERQVEGEWVAYAFARGGA